MRAKTGWGVSIIGVLLALLGIALMIYLGPDGRRSSGPHPVETDGIAIVTAPKTLSWVGLRIDVLAELPANKPVFVGLGNAVDVDNYVDKTARIEVKSFHTPWTVKTRTVEGESNLPAAPTSLDWWLASNAGLGGASIDTTLPSQTVRLAILSVGSSNLRGLNLTVAYGVKGGFAKGAGLALLGIGGVWFGRMLRRGDRFWAEDEDVEEIEEVVYVYIDEDGVEHEISAEEAEQYEIEDVVVEEIEPEDETEPDPEPQNEAEPEPDPEPEPEPLPAPKASRWTSFTAGAIAEEQPEPEDDPKPVLEVKPAPEPEPNPDPVTPTPEPVAPKAAPVVYVFIDEDGVEHEISEDELDDYEFVDDDDDEEEKRP